MFEFNRNTLYKMASHYLFRGWKLVRLHGVTKDGRCTCGKSSHSTTGNSRAQCGKHPIDDDWPNHVAITEDDLDEWMERAEPFNIGVQLGPKSGIIDVEWDNEEGQAFAEEIGLTEIQTPTYISGRSEHRLFLWDDALSVVGKATIHVRSLEIRMGGLEVSAQSVLPPSWHWSGVQYRWKPGFSLDDVEIQPLPDTLLIALVNDNTEVAVGEKARQQQRRIQLREWLHNGVGEGDRHDFLKGMAVKEVMAAAHYQSSVHQADIVERVHCLNVVKCKDKNGNHAPKDREEIESLVAWAVEKRRKREESCAALPLELEEIEEYIKAEEVESESVDESGGVKGWALQGLKFKPIPDWEPGEWMPGSWFVQMVHSDPPEIVLCVPQWSKSACKGRITMTLADFLEPRAVAKRVFEATRSVILDGDEAEWYRLWKGQSEKRLKEGKKRPKIVGLAEKLIAQKQKKDDIFVGASSMRFAVLAGWLLEAFKKATAPRDEEKPEPNESGRPCWVKQDELWFKWQKTWEDIERMHSVNVGERAKLRHMICDEMQSKDLPEQRFTFGGTVRHTYVVFDHRWYEAVERLAAGRAKADSPK